MLDHVRRSGGRIERIVLTRNRRVMASLAEEGRTLRVHEVFQSAPPDVLEALADLFTSRSASVRTGAKGRVRAFLQGALPPPAPRTTPVRRRAADVQPGDSARLDRLRGEFARVNHAYFGGRLPEVPLRLSSRMSRRNGHFMSDPLEIAISRTLCDHAAEGEAERTLRHEMIHLWQWAEGRKPGHGRDFRRWAERLGIHPRATRTVCWIDPAA